MVLVSYTPTNDIDIWTLANFVYSPNGTQEDIPVRYGCQPNAYAGKGILLLKLIVHHAPKLLVFVCSLHLRLSKPPWHHVSRRADDWRLSLREKTVRRLNRQRTPEHRLHVRKKISLARDMLEGFQQLFPAGFQG